MLTLRKSEEVVVCYMLGFCYIMRNMSCVAVIVMRCVCRCAIRYRHAPDLKVACAFQDVGCAWIRGLGCRIGMGMTPSKTSALTSPRAELPLNLQRNACPMLLQDTSPQPITSAH